MRKLSVLRDKIKNADRKSLAETLKSVLIAALSVTALLLAYNVGLFSGMTSLKSVLGASEDGSSAVGEAYASAASPFTMVVTPEAGTHCAVMYDGESLDSVYARFSPSLGEALGSSGSPVSVTEQEWRDALRGQSVYFDYLDAQYIPVLAMWLGTDVTGGASLHMARRFCLAKDGDGVALYYYRTRQDTGAYKCSTALSWSDISSMVEEYIPNGAKFNFELENGFSLVDSCSVISNTQISLRSLTAKDPLLAGVDDQTVMSAFGMNSFLAIPYTESDGAVICVEGDSTLRLGSDGVAVFTGGDGSGEDTLSAAQVIETGRALCAATIGAESGEADVYLSYIWHDTETGSYKLTFDYSVNGLPVSLPDGENAAELIISGSAVTYARLVFRQYSFSDGVDRPLPSNLSAAVVQASGGGENVLSYVDDMESVKADWMIR